MAVKIDEKLKKKLTPETLQYIEDFFDFITEDPQTNFGKNSSGELGFFLAFFKIPPTIPDKRQRLCDQCDEFTEHEFYDTCLSCNSWGYMCKICGFSDPYGFNG